MAFRIVLPSTPALWASLAGALLLVVALAIAARRRARRRRAPLRFVERRGRHGVRAVLPDRLPRLRC